MKLLKKKRTTSSKSLKEAAIGDLEYSAPKRSPSAGSPVQFAATSPPGRSFSSPPNPTESIDADDYSDSMSPRSPVTSPRARNVPLRLSRTAILADTPPRGRSKSPHKSKKKLKRGKKEPSPSLSVIERMKAAHRLELEEEAGMSDEGPFLSDGDDSTCEGTPRQRLLRRGLTQSQPQLLRASSSTSSPRQHCELFPAHLLDVVRRVAEERARQCGCESEACDVVSIVAHALDIVFDTDSEDDTATTDADTYTDHDYYELRARASPSPVPLQFGDPSMEADAGSSGEWASVFRVPEPSEAQLQLQAVQAVNHSLMDEMVVLRHQVKSAEKKLKEMQAEKAVASSKPFAGLGKKAVLKLVATPSNVLLEEELGRGGSSAVVYGCSVGPWKCAVKVLETNMCSPEDVACFKKEQDILRQLKKHDNVMELLLHCNSPTRMSCFLPRYTCTLREYLDRDSIPLAPEVGLNILKQVAAGVAWIHKFHVIHCDLKAANVFLLVDLAGSVSRVAIGDFDCAVVEGQNFQAHSGTPGYSAPEFLGSKVSQRRPSPYWDVYSFGVVIFEVTTKAVPFAHLRGQKRTVKEAVLAGERPEVPKDVIDKYPRALWGIYKNCLRSNSNDRMPIELASHMLSLLSEDPSLTYSGMYKSFKSLVMKEAHSINDWKTTKLSLV